MRSRSFAAAAFAVAVFGTCVPASAAPAPAPAPLTVQDAIATALARNPAYLQAATEVASAEARVRQAQAVRGVSVTAQDGVQYVDPVARLSTPFGSLPFSPSNVSSTPLITGSFSLYDGGVSAARIAQAEAAVAQARSRVLDARERTASAAANAYYQLAAATAQRGVADAAVDAASAHVRQSEQFLRAGTAPRADVLRARTELADERVRALDARNAVAVAQARLDQVMGVSQTLAHVPTDGLDAPVPAVDLDRMLAQATTSRGDLAAAQNATVAAAYAVKAAQAAHRPTVSVSASDGNVQPPIESGYHNQFTVGINAVWRLVDGGDVAARVAEAQAGVDQARFGVQALAQSIELEVRTAYLDVAASRERVAAARELVASADENLRLARIRTQGGVGTTLEQQDAEVRARDAHRALVDSQIALHTAAVNLQAAAGILPGS